MQILLPDNIAGKGKISVITVNRVFDGVDCCCVGFLPRTYVVKEKLWDGILCQVMDVFKKTIPPSCDERSGITTRGMHVLLFSLMCHLALVLFPRRRIRTWEQRVVGKRLIKC